MEHTIARPTTARNTNVRSAFGIVGVDNHRAQDIAVPTTVVQLGAHGTVVHVTVLLTVGQSIYVRPGFGIVDGHSLPVPDTVAGITDANRVPLRCTLIECLARLQCTLAIKGDMPENRVREH